MRASWKPLRDTIAFHHRPAASDGGMGGVRHVKEIMHRRREPDQPRCLLTIIVASQYATRTNFGPPCIQALHHTCIARIAERRVILLYRFLSDKGDYRICTSQRNTNQLPAFLCERAEHQLLARNRRSSCPNQFSNFACLRGRSSHLRNRQTELLRHRS
jgi:hypothetical protein